jgi:hypothetical protein
MIIFQDEMKNLTKFGKIYTFLKFIFIQQLTQNMWYIGPTIYVLNNKLQKSSLKFFCIWKNEKYEKKTPSLFIK